MPIMVKGERNGLVLALPATGSNTAVLDELAGYLEQAGGFFKGANVAIDVGNRALNQEELASIRELLRAVEVQSDTLRSFNEETRASALALGMEVPFVVAPDIAQQPAPQTPIFEESTEALLVRRTLRSGQSIRYPGAVVVLGDVNPGAEIISGGDVMVWGALRGLVHAGATGDEHARVCALQLAANQLRIAGHIAVAPDTADGKRLWQRRKAAAPEQARVQDGGIVVEKWLN